MDVVFGVAFKWRWVMKSKVGVRGSLVSMGLVVGVLVACGTMFAHHGSALEYQMDKNVTVKGMVTEFVWANPHARLKFDVANAQGNPVHWITEMDSPGVLTRSGWNKKTIQPGDAITVTMHPSRSGEPVGLCGNILLPDGRSVGCYGKADLPEKGAPDQNK
jgi:hypothetical protein